MNNITNTNEKSFHPAETVPLEKYKISPTKNLIAMLIALLFVVFAGYSAYKYFLKSGVIPEKASNNNGEITSGEKTVRKEQNNIIEEIKLPTETQTTIWVANDYKFGDIKQGNYTVKSGDTLWEIAEAVYGDGTGWVKILDVNPSSIGYLSGGQQALIYTGQTLVIP